MAEINPDSVVLQQMREHWQKVAALLVWKLAKNGVTIDAKDMAAYQSEFMAGGQAYMMTLGHHDGFTLKMVNKVEAERIAAYDDAMRKGANNGPAH